jgi:hypothetical protein
VSSHHHAQRDACDCRGSLMLPSGSAWHLSGRGRRNYNRDKRLMAAPPNCLVRCDQTIFGMSQFSWAEPILETLHSSQLQGSQRVKSNLAPPPAKSAESITKTKCLCQRTPFPPIDLIMIHCSLSPTDCSARAILTGIRPRQLSLVVWMIPALHLPSHA